MALTDNFKEKNLMNIYLYIKNQILMKIHFNYNNYNILNNQFECTIYLNVII